MDIYNATMGVCKHMKYTYIERTQDKVLRGIVDKLWYVSNEIIGQGLNKSYKYHTKLEYHPNPIIREINRNEQKRRKNKKWSII